jgi:hypothetical protein
MMTTVNPIQAAEDLALMVWDIIGNASDAADSETVRAAAGRALVSSWRSPRVPRIEMARTLANIALSWADGEPNALAALKDASRSYEEHRIKRRT